MRQRAVREQQQLRKHAEVQRRIAKRCQAVVEEDRRTLQREVSRLRSRLACQTKERLRLVSVKREIESQKQVVPVAAPAKPSVECVMADVEVEPSEGAAIKAAANSNPDEGEQRHANDALSSSSSESDSDL